MNRATPAEVLGYWFGEGHDWPAVVQDNTPRWFQDGATLDDEIRGRFGPTVAAARAGELQDWGRESRSCLALILCLDQFPRHIHRGTAEAFASDEQALAVCQAGLEIGLDQALSVVERSFFYLPLEHAESPEQQRESLRRFESALAAAPADLEAFARNALDYARSHHGIVERFGRFPHRNGVLGRSSSPEETAFLDGGGARFGQ